MKFEHIALNVADPLGMSNWYTAHLGLTVKRQQQEPPYTTFLADDSGNMMLEIYKNPPDEIPDYWQMEPLLLHLAFVSPTPGQDMDRLIEAGARLVVDEHLDDNSRVIMLRDPWGIPIQLCKRGNSMLTDY